VFREYGEWLHILGIEDVGSLNDEAAADGLRHEVLVSEALHERDMADMADEITGREVRMVLVAGPSSSGKTTFSKRLAVQLMVNGAAALCPGARRLFRRPRADAARRAGRL
jgi:uridine kinase